MTIDTDLGARLKAMALTILRDAEHEPLGMRLDALKVCTMLHIGLEKMSAGVPETPPADEGMLGMRKRIEEAGNGGGK